jgi:hypothetical protein
MSTDPALGALPPAESTLEVVDLMDDQGGVDGGDGGEGEVNGEEEEKGGDEDGDGTSDSDGDKDIKYTTVDTSNRKLVKNLRHYSYGLVISAAENGWEEEEIVRLIKLVTTQLKLSSEQVIHLLDVTKTGSPATLCCLLDDGSGNGSDFTDTQLVSVLLSHASNVNHFINLVGEAFGCDLFSAGNANTLDVVSYSYTLRSCLSYHTLR